MVKSKVVLLGAQGSLGEAIKREFVDTYDVISFSRADLDIEDFVKTRECIQNSTPDLNINCSAYNAVDLCEENEDEFKKAQMINGYAVENLGKISRDLHVPLIHYSTDYVFDGTKQEGVREDDPTCPINRYGKSKLLGEELLAAVCTNYYILRVSWLFGIQGSGKNTKKSFVDIVQCLAETKDELTLVDDESSSPTYTADIAQQTKYIFEHALPYGIYHVNNSGTASWYEYGKEILNILGIQKSVRPVSSTFFPRPAKRPPFVKLLNTKLPPIRSWHEALKEYIHHSH